MKDYLLILVCIQLQQPQQQRCKQPAAGCSTTTMKQVACSASETKFSSSNSSGRKSNPDLVALPLHDPDGRLARRRSGVRLLPRRLHVRGEVLLPHGGRQRGVRVALALCVCLRLQAFCPAGRVAVGGGFLEGRRRAAGRRRRGRTEAPPSGQRRSPRRPPTSQVPLVPEEVFPTHILLGERQSEGLKLVLLFLCCFKVKPRST